MTKRSPEPGAVSHLEILSVRAASAGRAAAFFHASLQDTFADTFPPEAIAKYRDDFSAEKLTDQVSMGDRVLLTAVLDHAIVGIMFGGPSNGGIAHIIWLAVAPGLRSRGIGRKLVEAAFRRYRDVGVHKLVVYTETEAARRFYERVGMRLEGTHPNHWWGVTHYCLAREVARFRSQMRDG